MTAGLPDPDPLHILGREAEAMKTSDSVICMSRKI